MKQDYQQILRLDICCGKFSREEKLPPLRKLADEYQCSLTTIKRAVDSLQSEGLLQAFHGKGVFISGKSQLRPLRIPNKVIGAVLLRSGLMEAMEELKPEFMLKGWLIAAYDAEGDMQSPKHEKIFLQHALSENFSSIIVAATPIEPTNDLIFVKMRQQGVKVLHLSAYKTDMSSEVFVMPDSRHIGQLAVGMAAKWGCSNVVYCSPPSIAPQRELNRLGIRDMADGLALCLHDDIIICTWDAQRNLSRTVPESEDMKSVMDIAGELKLLPPATAILCPESDIAWRLELLRKKVPGIIHEQVRIISMNNMASYSDRVNGFRHDWKKAIEKALAYSTDSTITATMPFQKYLQPVWHEVKEP